LPALRGTGLAFALALGLVGILGPAGPPAPSSADGPRRVPVPADRIVVDDGDTVGIRWPEGREEVRLLGIDCPETFHPEHDLPYPQPFGEMATGFLVGCLAVAERVELLRAAEPDPYGRTLGYLFLDGKNYSVLVLEARLAVETVRAFGDSGFPEEAKACLEAARRAGPVAFERPDAYRRRMKAVSAWLRERGLYPGVPAERR
jgi:micrococcal nuclease